MSRLLANSLGSAQPRKFDASSGTLIPYAFCCLLTAAMLGLGGRIVWSEVGPALALELIVGAILLAVAGNRVALSAPVRGLVICGFLLSVALLRDGTAANAGYGPLVLLPVMWASTQGRRKDLAVAVAGVAAVYLVPVAVVGGPQYPVSNLRGGLLLAAMSAAIGISIVQLVRRERHLLAEMRDLALTDELTGLPNRRAWEQGLVRELAAVHRTDEPLVIALLDLDAFKAYNDTHGHLAGDRLLRHAVAAWQGALRAGDTMARWGGDEFGLLLPACTLDQAEIVLARLRTATDKVPFSAGLVCWDGEAHAEELISAADSALYAAKRAAAPVAG